MKTQHGMILYFVNTDSHPKRHGGTPNNRTVIASTKFSGSRNPIKGTAAVLNGRLPESAKSLLRNDVNFVSYGGTNLWM